MGLGSWILMGLLAGAVAKFLLPGKDPGGCVMTIVIGLFAKQIIDLKERYTHLRG